MRADDAALGLDGRLRDRQPDRARVRADHRAATTTGVVSAYTYAFAFFQLPHGLVAVSIMTTLGPELASLARRGDTAALRARFSLGLRSLLVVVTPAAVGYVVLSRQIVVGLIEHGLFGHASAVLTADALRGFAVGLVPFSVYLYALRGFYALRDTKTPFVVNCLENALNIVFAAILYPALRDQRPRVRVLGRVRGRRGRRARDAAAAARRARRPAHRCRRR